jgi:hypothetical protein
MAWYVVGEALDLDFSHDLLEDATLGLDADGDVDEGNGDGDTHHLVHGDALHVDVEELALDGLVLPVNDHGLAALAAGDLEIEDGVVAGFGVEDAGDDAGIYGDGDGGLARAVDDGRDETGHADAAGVALVELAFAGGGYDRFYG